tara:strand:+ start:114 stop:788 length:675 start_codon:yes stop_codon:yes gene_type:complete
VNIFGIKIKFSGIPEKENVFFVSNHISYLDILILGSMIDGLFIAKSEIKSWPLINKIAALGKTIFVNRKEILNVKEQMNIVGSTLRQGYNVILFPEGTSSDGSRVLPFKSSLFGLVDFEDNKDYKIQPISIFYSKLDGVPVEKKFRPLFAWFGSMDLISHAWKFLGLGVSEVKINFHSSKKFSSFKDRKDSCRYCYNTISDQISKNYGTFEVDNKVKLNEFKFL